MAESNDIPAPVRNFLVQRIDSVVQLELLLLLYGNTNRCWSADEVAKELRIESTASQEQLDRLRSHGLAELSPMNPSQYCYNTSQTSHDAEVRYLAREYAVRRVSVISLIYSKPTDTLRSFADAFRLFRKEKDDG
jgi:predicted ArsR family transcriptional regulator